jgi:hypothetical protein
VYAALDDALTIAGIEARDGKLIPRRGPAPDVDDREVLCLSVLQELLGFESDNAFYLWFEASAVMRSLFPRRLSRPNWADRRLLLAPIADLLSSAFCAMNGEEAPPFSSSTPIRSMSAARSARASGRASAAWRATGTARR